MFSAPLRKKIQRTLPPALLLAAMLAVYASGVLHHIHLESLKLFQAQWQSWLNQNFVLGACLFVVCYVVVVALSLPIALMFTLLGGALFSSIWGALLDMVGATLGAAGIFIIARTSFGEVLRRNAATFYAAAKKEMDANAISYLLFIRLVPVFPFFLANIIPALFPIPLRTFVLTTFIGIAPASFIYANIGANLSQINQLSDILSTNTLLAFGLLGVLALVPVLVKKIRHQIKG
ncbi:MAG: VTT domain-containing protein [Alphaproteobacteria bacterium]